jgi:7,8-dihydropterin-6-yl-methyl-4-(beta-D-ribofuranosyl)aminobenzene 5'-phosphate synthase
MSFTEPKFTIMLGSLAEVDELEIIVIVDNEVDVMSAIAPGTIVDSRRFPDIAFGGSTVEHIGEMSINVMPMEGICCGAHGLSVMVVS